MTIRDAALLVGSALARADLESKRATIFNVTDHESIYEIDPADWNEIVEEGVWQTHGALALLEHGGLDHCRPRYLVFRTKDGRIAAHTTAYIIETDLLIFSQGAVKQTKSAGSSRNFYCRRFLSAAAPLVSAILSAAGRRGCGDLGPLCDALERLAVREGIRFLLLRDFAYEDVPELARFAQQGFSRISNLPTTQLTLHWHIFEDYFPGMRSRYRKKYGAVSASRKNRGSPRAGRTNSPTWRSGLRDNDAM